MVIFGTFDSAESKAYMYSGYVYYTSERTKDYEGFFYGIIWVQVPLSPNV